VIRCLDEKFMAKTLFSFWPFAVGAELFGNRHSPEARAAKQIGLTIPPNVLAKATR
jgi:hypothetical protein